MLVSVMTPQERIVPLPAVAEQTESGVHFLFVSTKGPSQPPVLLVYAPEFERIIELIDLRNLYSPLLDVIESELRTQEMVEADRPTFGVSVIYWLN
jgi:hypothetical protein